MADAEKRMKAFTLFSGNQKFEDAVELLEKAAACYKQNKNWQEAGETYAKAAKINGETLKEQHDCGVSWENAAKAFKNVNTKEALRCYMCAVDILMENNKFSSAAKIWKEMGALQEKEHSSAAAMASFEKAANCYEADNNAQSNASAMWIKVADLAADAEDYKKAIQIYEKVSKSSVESSALRWSVKDYLFKALLCRFVLAAKSHKLDGVSAKLENYVDMCPNMDNTREKQLIEELIQDFEANDADAYADHVFKFDEIMPLDRWKSKVLLEIKKALEGGNPEDNEVGV